MNPSIRQIGLFTTLLLLVVTHDLYAQPGQCLVGGCNTGVAFGALPLTTTSNVFVNATAGTWAGEYNIFDVTIGQQYEWSLCTADGATNPSADMTLTLTSDVTNGILCFSDNVCGNQPKILWTSTLTGTVRVYLHTPACGTNSVSYTLRWRCVSCAAPVAPSNDLICNATPIDCGQTLAGTTVNATLSGTGEGLACGGTPTRPGVWYTIPGNGQIMTASLCGTVWDSRIQVFSGANCNTVTCVGGNDDGGPACTGSSASYQWTSVVGVNYYIFVAGYASTSAFNLTLTCAPPPTPPINDLICNAVSVTCGQTVNGTTINATPNGTGEGVACGGFTQSQPGVWYSIVGTGNNINASLCATAWDSRIQVYTGANCSTVTCVGGNDNNGPLCAGNAASYSWLAANGQTYYILVSGATATTSAFTLSMACQTPCTSTCSGGPPPANDACGGAQNLGAIPTPAACPNGVGIPVNFNLTNVCATAEPNYVSLLNCQPAGNQAAPAADVWYRFTLVAPILNITVNGLGTPNVALYEGTNCANLLPRACAIGSGGYLNTQVQGLAGGTYYLQISGGDVLDQCTFTLTLQNNYDCSGCVLAANLDATPPPVNGQYQPGTLVTFCYTITSYQQTSVNWLHGVVPTFGPGWDMTSFVALPTTTVGGATSNSCAANGTWSWYNTNVTSSATGLVTGPGFYFETAAGGPAIDGNPGNNFGDSNPGNCAWTFCWQIRTKQLAECTQDQGLNVNINTTGDGESGSWGSPACNLDPQVTFFSQSNCCPTPTVTVTNPTCTVPTGSAVGQGLGSSPWTYVWKNAAGATIQSNPNTAGISNITGLAPGDYTLTVTDATSCTSFIAFSILALINNAVSSASSSPTLCINTALTNITHTTSGATGISNAGVSGANGLPAGVSASWASNAITISGTPTAAGTFNYSIPLSGGCGSANATGTITVTAANTVGAASSSPTLCISTSLINITHATTGAIGISNAGVSGANGLPAGVSASWASNTITISGIPTVAGTFNYTIPLTGGCGGGNAIGTITVTANMTATSTSPNRTVCVGQPLSTNITFTTTGATGIGAALNLPAGVTAAFTGNAASGTITISGTPSSATGSPFPYSVPLTGGCGTVNATGTITVNAIPTASITSSTSLCPGSASNINFTGTPGASLSWSNSTGGSGISVINNTTGTVGIGPGTINTAWTTWPAGTVITFSQVSLNGCTSALNVVVSVTSSLNVTVSAQSPICAGGTSQLTFTGTSSATVTYNLGAGNFITNTGPTGTVTVTSPALITNTTVTVTSVAIAGGCSQILANTAAIVVNPSTTPLFNPIGPFCFGATSSALPTISNNGVSGTWNPASVNTNLVGVTNYTFTPSGTCPASPLVVPVTIHPLPLVYAHGTNPTCSSICNGSALVDITNGTAPYNINWSNGGTTANITNLCIGSYTVTVTDANGCQSQAFTPVSGCFQIQSIGVDACGLGGEEGLNEMFFIQVGATSLNLLSATVTWPSNSFTNFNCTNSSFIAAANATITSGGIILPVPAGGTLPANSNVVIMTSSTPNINPNTFANLSDTLYMAFHCATTSAGYFGNGSGSGIRTLTMNFGAGCSDVVSYDLVPLVDSDGAYVNFSQSGAATYLDYDCVAPFAVQDNSIVLSAPAPIIPTFPALTPYCIGSAIPALPTTSNEGITGTWNPLINNTTTTVYTFTPTAGICATTADQIITITPLNTVGVASSSPTLCINTTLTNITHATTGATGIGAAAGLPSGVSATWASNTITISGTPTAAGTFNYSIPLTGGCGGGNAIGTITVNPLNTAGAASTTPTICPNNLLAPITIATTGATGIGTVTGLPSGVSAAWNSNVITISGTPTIPGSYSYNIALIGGCGSVSASGSLTVSDILDFVNLQFPANATICQTGSFDAYGQVYNDGLITTVPNGQAAGITVQIGYGATADPSGWSNWTNATFNAQVGNNDEYKGTLNGLTPGTYYYAFRYQINGCAWQYGGYNASGGGFWNGSTANSGQLTVTATNNAGNDGAVTVCATGTSVNLFASLSGGAASTGVWSGPSTLGSGYLGTYNPLTNSAGIYTYTVSGGACPNDFSIVSVTISSSPTATVTYPSPVCTNISTAVVPVITGSTGGTFSATPSGMSLAANGGFVPSSTTPNTYNVTYNIAAASGCAAFSTTTSVVVTAPPIAPILSPSQVCSGASATFTVSGGAWYEFLLNGTSTGAASASNGWTSGTLNGGDIICVRSYAPASLSNNGSIENQWGAPLATNAGGPPSGFGANYINALYLSSSGGYLYGAIAGSLVNGSNNRILLFLDCIPGGYNNLSGVSLTGSPYVSIENLNPGITFDPGFNADFIIAMNVSGGIVYYDLFNLQSNTNYYLGSNNGATGIVPNALLGYSSAAGPTDFSSGFEFAVPNNLLGNPSGSISTFTMLVNDPGLGNTTNTTLSNQFLTPAGIGDNNYGNGPVFFGSAAPNPIQYILPAPCYSESCVTVTNSVSPSFTNPQPICQGQPAPTLPSSSNGVSGTWNPPTVSNQTTATYNFIPTSACGGSGTITVTVIPTPGTTLIFHD